MSLKNKTAIFNSDDFGHSHPFNMGVYKGMQSGVLATSCVLSNLEGYLEAVSFSKDFKGIKFGVHLNIVEGKSIKKPVILTDGNGCFNKSWVEILRKSNDKNFLKAVEIEFRAQIERILSDFEVNHINSHMHVHAIPNIFKMVIKLAGEYKIPYVRTQFERPYVTKSKKHFTLKYPLNLIKLLVLDFFSIQNKSFLPEGALTNDYLLGITYTGFMDKNSILDGLKAISSGICEILIHPAYYEKEILKPDNHKEFLITQDVSILDEIRALGFEISDCELNTVAVPCGASK